VQLEGWRRHCPIRIKVHSLISSVQGRQSEAQAREEMMLSAKHSPQRNIINLADPMQVKTLTRRLGISTADLKRIIEKSGGSIAAICKEAEIQRAAEASSSKEV
jgi:hypothetical protein